MVDRRRSEGAARFAPKALIRILRLTAILTIMLAPAAATAQSTGSAISPDMIQKFLNLPPDQIQQLIQSRSTSAQNTQVVVPPSLTPQQSVIAPAQSSAPPAGSSRIEEIMSGRAGVSLHQYGYSELGSQPVSATQVGAVQDDYLLGTGDQLDVTLRGQVNSEYLVTVDRDGRVIVPGLAPIAANGRTFGDFRRDLIAAVHRGFISTDVYASVAQVRQVSVLVVGEVNNPGQETLTGLSSVLDALNLAGGVKRAGSLRNITVIRAGHSFRVDIYSILQSRGRMPNLTLAQGDRILVPGIGPVVAIAGDVAREGIYELPPGSRAISQSELISLANGLIQRGVYRKLIEKIRPDGKEQLVDVTSSPGELIHDSEVLFVKSAVSFAVGKVSLTGSVRLPGQYSLDTARTVHDLLPSIEVFAPTPYMLMGVIVRTDPHTLQRTLIPFSPLHVLQGTENVSLISDDEVRILTLDQMRSLVNAQPNSDQNSPWAQGQSDTSGTGQFISVPGAPASTTAPAAAPAVSGTSATGAPAAPAAGTTAMGAAAAPAGAPATGMVAPGSAPAAATGTGTTGDAGTAASLGVGDLSASDASFFGRVLSDYRVTLGGAVRNSGFYLVSPGTNLEELIAAAGGLTSDADVSAFDITSTQISNATGKSETLRQTIHVSPADFHTIILHPLDVVEFHNVYKDVIDGQVNIAGEVRYPGSFSLLRGERLSQVLARAGGLTNVAYPYGTVFLRHSVADLERAGYQRIADDVQRQLLVQMTRGGGTPGSSTASAPSPDALAVTQAFVAELRNQKALGRVSIVADPSVLAAHPERDPILEPGDSVYIPQRPSTVTVLGDVTQPGSYPFDPKLGAEDYIELAGSYGEDPEKDLSYVVYPDGTAQLIQRSWLNFNSQGIPPGSVIYVPRDLFPLNWLVLTTSIGDVVRDMAVSIASVAVISKAN